MTLPPDMKGGKVETQYFASLPSLMLEVVERRDVISYVSTNRPKKKTTGQFIMEKFKGKFRISSARWSAWDYSQNAAYFITICIANRASDFGEISNGVMILSRLGQAALECWNEIPDHFPFVVPGGFVVMPNHVHGIVMIDKPDAAATPPVETQNIASLPTPARIVETQNIASLQTGRRDRPKNRFGP